MRQVQLERFGPPAVLKPVDVVDLEVPPGHLRLRVEAAGVTFVETQVRAGRPPWAGALPQLPLVLGNGVAGVVDRVGEGGERSLLGRRVVTATGGTGGYATHAIVPADAPHPLPPGIASPDAVALLADARTALAIVRAAAPRDGERVLVLAAAGGVGTFLVQLVAAAGSCVVAAAGSEPKRDLARRLGAVEAVDYTAHEWFGHIRHVDVLLDGVGGPIGGIAAKLLRQRGRLVSFGAASGAFADVAEAAARDLSLTTLPELIHSPRDNRELVARALDKAAGGEIRAVVGQTFPLDQAHDAHAAVEARETVGKTVLLP